MRGKIIIGLLLTSFFLTDCKKGEEDPFFSLRSRKARLTGEWTVTSAEWKKNDSLITYDGNLMITRNDSISADTLPVELTYSFDRNGSYLEKEVTEFPTNWMNRGNPAYTQTKEVSGIWNFTGGVGDVPSKSQLLLRSTKIEYTISSGGSNLNTVTYDGQPEGFVYDITMLKNSEMKLEYNLVVSLPGGSNTSSGIILLEKL